MLSEEQLRSGQKARGYARGTSLSIVYHFKVLLQECSNKMHTSGHRPAPRRQTGIESVPERANAKHVRLCAERCIYYKNNVQTIRVDTPTAKDEVVAGSGLLETLAPRIE